ncbi:PQQ-dependent sugar dehydrogenase [Algoriphagus sp. D3-2-R+10]|uniref:PQQ-dependent sugar dehydrogenase n=1 Tax=Algoriphagus aurantiacus TaxID=3103948 RepID=UPI002B39F373|nr:PQQ-dependent sugar dehydrogenase [Algoriphagus sp. D3-2-R+10]MEB2777605.1 PQQ-dependent sugar dehydrogenase [Algoriphagus sp. D3-2-R+10]
MRKYLLLFAVCSLSFWSCDKKQEDPFANVKPDESRFTKIPLAGNFNEPMEIEVLDNGDVLIIERHGKLKLFQAESGETSVVGELAVFPEREDGLMGMAMDPDFITNNWLYLYYAPASEPTLNRISRFDFVDNKLDLASEVEILDVDIYRGCCHSGGGLEFDAQGNLYLGIGDDSTPFESSNFNPIDERQDQPKNVDAQRSSGNTNDLRGAILRIKPNPEGGYSIPEGNLFPVGTPKTRPEIYVKGNRNPFRFSIDSRNGNLYWGEVGPDGSEDKEGRGPRGYDEINVATEPGYYGWPYFVGNNYAYWKYDFATGESLFQFDTQAPKNTSPNNTGMEILPAAKPALIYYPYAESEEFPMLGQGGRNAMAGQVYYREDYEESEVRFPGYYNEKLFIYDWMRNWIFTVSLTENFEYDTMERFMPETHFEKPMDMQFAKDGSLYVLEYGTFWRANNDDSGLYRIVFSEGNRKPDVKISADKTAGAAPLAVSFSSEGTKDPDTDDQVSIQWEFGENGATSTDENPTFTFDDPGVYKVKLTATDLKGEAPSSFLEVKVGNEAPTVSIDWQGNRSFYFGEETISYEVTATDKEDGNIDPSQIEVTIDYLEGGYDLIEMGHQEQILSIGETYINEAGCKACHGISNESVGPDYTSVSEKYKSDPEAKSYLIDKVRNGGAGVWGEQIMPGHTHLKENKVGQMIDFVLGISNPTAGTGLPASGGFQIENTEKTEGIYLVQASYEDQGANGIPGIKTTSQLKLRNTTVSAYSADGMEGAARANPEDEYYVQFTSAGSWLLLKAIDLNQISEITLSIMPVNTKGKIQLRSGSPEGKLIAETEIISKGSRPASGQREGWFDFPFAIPATGYYGDLYFVYASEDPIDIWNTFNLSTLKFER